MLTRAPLARPPHYYLFFLVVPERYWPAQPEFDIQCAHIRLQIAAMRLIDRHGPRTFSLLQWYLHERMGGDNHALREAARIGRRMLHDGLLRHSLVNAELVLTWKGRCALRALDGLLDK